MTINFCHDYYLVISNLLVFPYQTKKHTSCFLQYPMNNNHLNEMHHCQNPNLTITQCNLNLRLGLT